jgi:hypothetical protein
MKRYESGERRAPVQRRSRATNARISKRGLSRRDLMGGQGAIDRFLRWSVPSEIEPDEIDDQPDDNNDED